MGVTNLLTKTENGAVVSRLLVIDEGSTEKTIIGSKISPDGSIMLQVWLIQADGKLGVYLKTNEYKKAPSLLEVEFQ
ncbi:MAG: hypothetical protein LBV04_08630 [Deferribacteraceae bacterium]|jgi:hypothetical protein|nr:hypothetical protein [Deferribacteraceae bacterium]